MAFKIRNRLRPFSMFTLSPFRLIWILVLCIQCQTPEPEEPTSMDLQLSDETQPRSEDSPASYQPLTTQSDINSSDAQQTTQSLEDPEDELEYFDGEGSEFVKACKEAQASGPDHPLVRILLEPDETCSTAFLRLNSSSLIDLAGKSITDISFLKSLKKTEHLILTDNKINSLETLAQLSQLESLDISFNQIHDLSPLSSLKNLRSLNAENNKIEDLGPLANLVKLEEIMLSHNQISQLTPLTQLRSVTQLSLAQNKIKDLMPLKNLNTLSQLDVSSNELERCDGLEYLLSLSVLDLSRNPLKDISPVTHLKSLDELYLHEVPADLNLSPLDQLPLAQHYR